MLAIVLHITWNLLAKFKYRSLIKPRTDHRRSNHPYHHSPALSLTSPYFHPEIHTRPFPTLTLSLSHTHIHADTHTHTYTQIYTRVLTSIVRAGHVRSWSFEFKEGMSKESDGLARHSARSTNVETQRDRQANE